MPTADGPCRFGQYAPYLRHILDANGYRHVEVLSPTSSNAYGGLGDLAGPFVRTGWRALRRRRHPAEDAAAAPALRARSKGDADAVYEECLDDLCRAIENAPDRTRRRSCGACATAWCAAATASAGLDVRPRRVTRR